MKKYINIAAMCAVLRLPEKKDPRPFVTLKVQDKAFQALADTGATTSVMSEKLFEKLPGHEFFEEVHQPKNYALSGAGGGVIKTLGRYEVPIDILGMHVKRPFYVVKGLTNHDCIIGIDTLKALQLSITGDSIQLKTVMPSLVPGSHVLHPGQDFVVPARTVMRKRLFLQDQVNGPKQGDLLVIDPNFMVPHSWEGISEVGENGEVWCVLSNLLDEDVLVHADTAVATADHCSPEEIRPLTDEDLIYEMQEGIIPPGKIVDKLPEPSEDAAPALTGKDLTNFKSILNLECPQEWKGKYEALMLHFHDVFSKSETDLGNCKVIQHQVDLFNKNGNPIHHKQFPIPYAYRDHLYSWVDQLLAQGAIEMSRSAYNSPLFIVPKKNGKFRKVLDFRGINSASKPDKYCVRDTRECVDEVGMNNSQIFSAADLTSGFWQQELEENSRHLTAFTLPGKDTRYQWTVAPMGLSGAPSSFARLMDYIMRGVPNCITYIDDLLLHTKDHDSQLKSIRECFLRLRKYGMKLNGKKSTFGAKEVEYLGFHLSGKGVSPGTDKTEAIKKYPEPTNLKKIREFTGLANYFRFLIPNCSKLVRTMTALTKANSGYKKGSLPLAAQTAFRKLKQLLCSKPVVCPPAKVGEWRVTTDASQGDAENPGGLGAVLTQVVEGTERVVAYASRKLDPHEKNYSPYLLEMAAACWAMDEWDVFLRGRHFDLYTDHRPLTTLGTIHKKTLNRLQLKMMEYDFSLHYRKGVDNEVADALSRNPVSCAPRSEFEPTEAMRAEPVAALSDNSGDLKSAQQEDPLCQDIRAWIDQGIVPQGTDSYAQMVMRIGKDAMVTPDGYLYYYNVRQGRRPVMAIIVPESLRALIMEAAHNTWHAGHAGKEKTVDRAMLRYYWPGIHTDVDKYIKRCPVCQQVKGTAPPPAPLQSLPLCLQRNERVHIDLLGPLKTSEEGNKYVLCMTDAFSKVVEITAIPDKKAQTVAKAFFEKWICRYSVPIQVNSDQGKEFCNELMEDLSKLLGFKRKQGTAFHPQSNAQVEVFNKSLIKYLRQALDNMHTTDWEEFLPMMQFSFNCQVHKATLESPFWLTHLMDPRLPYFDLENPRPLYKHDYASEAFQKLTFSHRLARENLASAKEIREEYYNRKAKERQFHVGDRVLFFNQVMPEGTNKKFYKNWQGVYYVIKKLSPLNYVIQRNPNSRLLKVHIEKIKHLRDADFKEHFDSKKLMTSDSAENWGEFQDPPVPLIAETPSSELPAILKQVKSKEDIMRQWAQPDEPGPGAHGAAAFSTRKSNPI